MLAQSDGIVGPLLDKIGVNRGQLERIVQSELGHFAKVSGGAPPQPSQETDPRAGGRPARGRRHEGRVRLDRAPAAGLGQGRFEGQQRAEAQRHHREGTAPGPADRPRQHPGDRPEPGRQVPGPRALRHRPGRAGPAGQARPGDRPRPGNPPRDPGPFAADEEQSGADRRAGRRQDRHRRGAGPADRRRRRAGKPEEQAA